MKISNGSRVLVVYFSDEDAKSHILIHKGTAGDFRKIVGEDWDGFGMGDRFEIDFGSEDIESVRIFKMSSSLLEDDIISGHQYFVGPADLNSNKVKYNNLNFKDYAN